MKLVTKMDENEISKVVVNCCLKVHKFLGPGLLESVYEEALAYELLRVGLQVQRQYPVPVYYGGITLPLGFRIDLLINQKLVIEIKSVEALLPVHYKQIITYLKLADIKLGLLVNFNVELIKNGIKRVANGL